jgi:hypothetical protein
VSGLSEAYEFDTELWEWGGKASWYFASLPEAVTDEIDGRYGHLAAGFGSFKVEVTVGETTWRTSVFPDAKRGTLILPVKKDVRRREDIDAGDRATFVVRVFLD